MEVCEQLRKREVGMCCLQDVKIERARSSMCWLQRW